MNYLKKKPRGHNLNYFKKKTISMKYSVALPMSNLHRGTWLATFSGIIPSQSYLFHPQDSKSMTYWMCWLNFVINIWIKIEPSSLESVIGSWESMGFCFAAWLIGCPKPVFFLEGAQNLNKRKKKIKRGKIRKQNVNLTFYSMIDRAWE